MEIYLLKGTTSKHTRTINNTVEESIRLWRSDFKKSRAQSSVFCLLRGNAATLHGVCGSAFFAKISFLHNLKKCYNNNTLKGNLNSRLKLKLNL